MNCARPRGRRSVTTDTPTVCRRAHNTTVTRPDDNEPTVVRRRPGLTANPLHADAPRPPGMVRTQLVEIAVAQYVTTRGLAR